MPDYCKLGQYYELRCMIFVVNIWIHWYAKQQKLNGLIWQRGRECIQRVTAQTQIPQQSVNRWIKEMGREENVILAFVPQHSSWSPGALLTVFYLLDLCAQVLKITEILEELICSRASTVCTQRAGGWAERCISLMTWNTIDPLCIRCCCTGSNISRWNKGAGTPLCPRTTQLVWNQLKGRN